MDLMHIAKRKMDVESDQSIEAMDTQEVESITNDLQQQRLQQQINRLHMPNENGNVPPQQLLAADNTNTTTLTTTVTTTTITTPTNINTTTNSPYILNEQEMTNMDDTITTNTTAAAAAAAASTTDTSVQVEDQFRAETTFSYEVKNIACAKGQILSPPVLVRMLPWKIMIMPNERALGFFLQCNGENDSPAWSCNAIAELRLKSYKPGVQPFTRQRIKHLFYSKENDYGYSNFIPWQDLHDQEKGYVLNNSITLEVYVCADAPHGVLWDSKKHTGYVGLKNQGATCYMNSLLQTLYFTNQLRRAVYKIPTEADDSTKSVGLSLQRVFHELQFGDRPVGTKRLTKSFGWETLDSFMQHDVQEFLRVLLDKLESKMKGTTLEGTIPGLFEGKMSSYIKCKNVDYNSTRYETFYDIQLNIKDKKNIFESFEDYIASETLEGENKYDAGVHGLQEASKGVQFTAFPPVLHLHLMRFQYDPITDSSIKYNDRFEFYDEMNLDRFLAAPEKTPAEYVLHAVLVHSGDNHGGHYVVFINPKADGKWFKFDDDVVATCTPEEAINQNYGGMDDEISFHAKCSNAYMLVYVRKSELERVLSDIPEDEIPIELVERLELEKSIEASRRRERAEGNSYLLINVILEEYFEVQQKRRLFDVEKNYYRSFKLKQTQTVDEMIDTFVKSFCVRRERMRIWIMVSGQPQKFMYFDFQHDGSRALEHTTGVQKPWTLFLELASPEEPDRLLPPFDTNSELLIFYKFYDARTQRLNYIGCAQQSAHKRVIDLVPEVNALLGFEPDTELSAYNECQDRKVTNINDTLETVFIPDDYQGYVLIFEKEQVDPNYELPNVEAFFSDLVFRVEVAFVDKANPNEPGFVLELSNRYNYEQMAQSVAERLNTDPNKLQFFTPLSQYKDKDQPGSPIPYNYKGTLRDLILYGKANTPRKLFYQRLSLSIHELDNKKQFKCIWVSNDLKEEKELVLYPNKDETVKALLEEAAKKITFSSENNRRKLRLLKVDNHKILNQLREDTLLESLQKSNEATITSTATGAQQKIFRIEEIPLDEQLINENELLIPVAHFSKEVFSTFGIPFFIKARRGEPYSALKLRIQKRLNVPDKEWENYKFAIIAKAHPAEINDNRPVDLDDYIELTNGQRPHFGLNHINKSRKRTSLNFSEKAIKIYN